MWALPAEKMSMTNEPDFIDVSETEDVREIELPRWVQVPVGIVLSLFTLLCGFASAYLLFVQTRGLPFWRLLSDSSCCSAVLGYSKSAFV
jgi:hypothetical protein